MPVVFTHGDLLPSNILVDEQSWHLNGLVDWAEAEFLPFGIGLYGLDHLLGGLSPSGAISRFVYLDEAGSLRRYFWRRLVDRFPELVEGELGAAVRLARAVGMLLWHGFAWDNGRLDRVISTVRDAEEVAYLGAFLHAALLGAYTRL